MKKDAVQAAEAAPISTLNLLPAEVPTPVDMLLEVGMLPADKTLLGPEPDKALLDSVRAFGVMNPIIVTEKVARSGKAAYRIHMGRRRVRAARALGLEYIPARVYPDGCAITQVMSLADHGTRRENAAQELSDICALVAKGAGESEIAAATGLAVARIRSVMRLQGLVPGLRNLFDKGALLCSVATEAARLPVPVQDALVARYEKDKRLTLKSVREVRVERNKEALGSFLDAAMAAAPSDAPVDAAKAHMDAGRRAAAELRHHLMAVRADLAPQLDALIASLAGGAA